MTNSVTRSTEDVDRAQAAAYWRDLICATFVEVAVRPAEHRGFTGLVTLTEVGGLAFARLAAGARQVDRTRTFIARGQDHQLLVNIHVRGQGLLAQDGRAAVLEPGSLTFVDSSRPYTVDFTDEFAQLVVRVAVSALPRRAFADATAIALGAARELVPLALGLLDTALGWAAGRTAGETSQPAVTRQRVHRFVRDHAGDPDLDAGRIAAGCRISRRTLFRALADDEPCTGLLRRIRVERAQRLLLAHPHRTVASIASDRGFAGPAQLHRTRHPGTL